MSQFLSNFDTSVILVYNCEKIFLDYENSMFANVPLPVLCWDLLSLDYSSLLVFIVTLVAGVM